MIKIIEILEKRAGPKARPHSVKRSIYWKSAAFSVVTFT